MARPMTAQERRAVRERLAAEEHYLAVAEALIDEARGDGEDVAGMETDRETARRRRALPALRRLAR